MTRASAVLLITLLATASTFDAGPPPGDTSTPQTSATRSMGDSAAAIADALAEYPHFDRTVRDLQRAEMAVRAASAADAVPDSIEKVEAYLRVGAGTYRAIDRSADALRAARGVIENRPEEAARVIELLLAHLLVRDEDNGPAMRALLAAASGKVKGLAGNQAAELAYQNSRLEAWMTGKASEDSLETIVREYAATEAALRATLDLMGRARPYDPWKNADDYARFAAEHAGTCAAAAALRREANEVGSNQGTRRANPDPTERILRVLAIEDKLDSPEYKACTQTLSGRSVGYVFANKPTYAPGNIDRVLVAYRAFLPRRLDTTAGDPDNGVGYLVLRPLAELFRARGDKPEAFDRFLGEMEAEAADPDTVRYLRALAYEPLALGAGPGEAGGPAAETVARLTRLHETANGLYRRKAVATLAWLHGFYGQTAVARQHYSAYAKAYPESRYAWVAALRAAECAADLGDWKAAASEYRAASSRYASMLVPRVLAHVYAARALEAVNEFAQAEAEYRRAIEGWDLSLGRPLTIGTSRRTRPSANPFEIVRDRMEVTTHGLEARLAQLTRVMAAPGGAVVEQGRWLVDHGRRKEAASLVSDFARRFPRSANVGEARYLAHKARLHEALDLLNVEGQASEAAGIEALDALSREPYDFPVTAAKIARACVLLKQRRGEDAEALMRAALTECVRQQPAREPVTALEKDVAAIRSLLFLPTGGAPYRDAARRWNAFSWPSGLPPFVLASAETRVKDATGRVVEVSLHQRYPGLDNVILLDADGLSFFTELMNKVGGTKKRAWTVDPQRDMQRGYLETPNQPIGPSMELLRFLNTFFPARPGHWGGWVFLTYPDITEIEFTDAARAKARAKVTIGYSGCTVLLEKQDGAWKATGMTGMWVT